MPIFFSPALGVSEPSTALVRNDGGSAAEKNVPLDAAQVTKVPKQLVPTYCLEPLKLYLNVPYKLNTTPHQSIDGP